MVRQFSTFGLAENGLSINLFRTSLSKRKLNSSAIHVVLQRGQYIYFTEYCKPEDTFQKTFFLVCVCWYSTNQNSSLHFWAFYCNKLL